MHETKYDTEKQETIADLLSGINMFDYRNIEMNDQLYGSIIMRMVNGDRYSKFNTLRIYTTHPLPLNVLNAITTLHGNPEMTQFLITVKEQNNLEIRYR